MLTLTKCVPCLAVQIGPSWESRRVCQVIIPSEVVFERFLNDRRVRGERRYAHILGRLAVEELATNDLYRWFVDWMNKQLSDLGVNSTGGVELPPLRFELVRVRNKEASAHVFETEEYSFI